MQNVDFQVLPRLAAITCKMLFAFLLSLEFLFQPLNLQVLPDDECNQCNREDWPNDAEYPDVDCVVTHTKEVCQPKENLYT